MLIDELVEEVINVVLDYNDLATNKVYIYDVLYNKYYLNDESLDNAFIIPNILFLYGKFRIPANSKKLEQGFLRIDVEDLKAMFFPKSGSFHNLLGKNGTNYEDWYALRNQPLAYIDKNENLVFNFQNIGGPKKILAPKNL